MTLHRSGQRWVSGRVLFDRRERAGISTSELAEADGRWTREDVFTIEHSGSVAAREVERYLRALRNLGVGGQLGG